MQVEDINNYLSYRKVGRIFELILIMKIVFASALLPLFISSNAQDSSWKKNSDSNAIVIHKDPRLDMLVKKQIQINEETSRDSRRVAKGYRLMVITTNSRDEAIAAKTKVYTYFPRTKSLHVASVTLLQIESRQF